MSSSSRQHGTIGIVTRCVWQRPLLFAQPRIVASILENNQTPDGIRVPKVLVPYMGCEMIK